MKSLVFLATFLVHVPMALAFAEQAERPELGAPVTTLTEGKYESKDGYFYKKIEITKWADRYLLSGEVVYGDLRHSTDFEITEIAGNKFTGTGRLLARYDSGESCVYPLEIEIFAYAEGLYIVTTQPAEIPRTKAVGRPCKDMKQRRFLHKKPYVFVP